MPENTTPPAPTQAVVPFNDETLSYVEFKDLARVMAESSFFKDAQTGQQAFAKMLVGRDLGIPVTRALCDIQMIQGKPTISANLIASLIKRSPKYKYRITTHTADECVIEFFEREPGGPWESLGVSSFSMKDAVTAGLTGNPTWKKFPRNMLFSRAISNGAKQHCGDVFLGSVYTPDELDPTIQLDDEGNIAFPARAAESARKAVVVATPAKSQPPADVPEVVEAVSVEEVPPANETMDTLIREVQDLARETGYDLGKFLREAKVKALNSLDAASLKNTRNTLRVRKEALTARV